MTDFSGAFIAGPSILDARAFARTTTRPVPLHELPPIAGLHTENRPTTILHRAISGGVLRSYVDDYYNRTWIIPQLLEYGVIATSLVSKVLFWNAHFTWESVTAVGSTGLLNGVTATGFALPITMRPLGLGDIFISASSAGDPTVDGVFTFAISSGEVLPLPVIGRRAFIWDTPFWPNWSSPVRVIYEFKTEVITSRLGYEQRIAYRQSPRKSVEFEVLQIDGAVAKHRAFRDLMRASQKAVVVVPEFPRRAFFDIDVAPDDSGFAMSNIPEWIYPGKKIILTDGLSSELLTVNTVGGGIVSVTSYIGGYWSASNSSIIAALSCYLGDSISGKVYLPTVTAHSIAAKQFPGDELPAASDGGSPGAIFDGREIFPFIPDWKTEFELNMQWPVDQVDYEYGTIIRLPIIDFPAQALKMSFWDQTEDKVDLARQFFTRMLGMQGEFFCPTFESDIVLKTVTPAGLNTVRIAGQDFYQTYVNSDACTAVMFYQADGSTFPAKVISVYMVNDFDGADTFMEFADNLPAAVGLTNTRMISWLFLARFGTDSLSVEWETLTVARYDMAVQTVRYVEAE